MSNTSDSPSSSTPENHGPEDDPAVSSDEGPPEDGLDKSGSTPLLPNGWRPAEGSAPEEGTSVIVAAWKCGRTETRARFEATYTGDGTFDRDSIGFPITIGHADTPIYYRVTHWAPMPTLPEKIEDYPEQNSSSRPTKPIEQRTSHLG